MHFRLSVSSIALVCMSLTTLSCGLLPTQANRLNRFRDNLNRAPSKVIAEWKRTMNTRGRPEVVHFFLTERAPGDAGLYVAVEVPNSTDIRSESIGGVKEAGCYYFVDTRHDRYRLVEEGDYVYVKKDRVYDTKLKWTDCSEFDSTPAQDIVAALVAPSVEG